MPSRRKRVSRILLQQLQGAIEQLEDRTLLSGNVLVSLSSSGALTIRGDQSANNISIQQTASGVQVSSSDGGATEINGGAGPFTASSSVNSISVALRGGDNMLQIGDPSGEALDITGKLTITATSGDNTISIANMQVGKSVSISVGRGNNSIVIGSTSSTGTGDPLSDVNLGSVSISGNLTVSAGNGSDTVAVVNVSVDGKTSLGVGSGDDDVSLMSSDSATISKSLVVSGGAGADQVLVTGYTVDGNVMIDTRQGNDTVGMFSNTFADPATVQGGGGSNSYLTNSDDFPNTFNGPSPHLLNLQTQSTDVLNNDAAFTSAFGWASDLLSAAGLLDLAPTAVNQTFTTSADTPLTTGNLLTNATDPESYSLSVASVQDSSGNAVPLGTATTLPSGAQLTVNANGTFTYNPNGAFDSLTGSETSTDTFTYTVDDGHGGTSASATATITITSGSQNPVAVNDSFSTTEGTPLTTGNLLTNDTDPNSGATLSVATVTSSNGTAIPLGTATTLPSGALLTVNANGTFTYNPNGAFDSVDAGTPATDTFTYTVSDTTGATSTSAGTVTITISAAQPVAVNDSFTTDAQTSLTTGNLLTNDTDSNPGATLSVADVLNASGGSVTLGTAATLPSGAMLTVNSDGTFDYNPNGAFSTLTAGQTATDSFTYSISDSRDATSANFATVTITITGSTNPIAVNDDFTTDNQTSLTSGNLLADDTDPNSGATLSVATIHDANGNSVPLGTATLLPSGALLTVNANGTFDYDPNGAFPSLGPTGTATDTFTYTVVDTLGLTSLDAGTVTITITSAKLVAVSDNFSTDELTPLTTGNLLASDTDPNTGATLSVASVHDSEGNSVPLGTATQLPSGALLTVNANGTFTYNPNGAFNSLTAGETATDTFTYTVVDSLGNTSVSAGTVTISITPTRPVAVNDAFSTTADTPLTVGNVLTNDTDATPGATLSVASADDSNGNAIPLGTATQLPSGAILTINADGTLNYNPNGAFNTLASGATATDTFTYTVSDNFGETSVSAATVTITITGV
jgi:VCBS repeat-containing protein